MQNEWNDELITNKDSSKLSRKERFIYSFTNLPNTILGGIFGLTYVNFFWDDLGLAQVFFVLGQGIYTIVNSLNDFYLGRISDNTDFKKWGSRRLIYVKWGGPLWAFIFFITWFPWSYSNQIVIFFDFLFSICAFDMLLTLVLLVWLALLPEMTENVEERNRMALYGQYFLIIGALPVLIAFLIFESGLLIFQIFSGACAIICGVSYYFVGSRLKERPELYANQPKIPLLKALKDVLKSRSFTSYTLFRSFNSLTGAMWFSFVFAYFYVLDVDLLTASLLFYFLATFVGTVGFLIYKILANKSDMRTLIIRGRALQIMVMIIGFFVCLPPENNLLIWFFLIFNGICGGYILFDFPCLYLVTDDDEVINGVRREGLILGTNAFFLKIAESTGPILATSVLLAFGFIRDSPYQTLQATIGIKFLLFVVPSIINFLGLLTMLLFPLHHENLKEMREKLLILHEKKIREYDRTK